MILYSIINKYNYVDVENVKPKDILLELSADKVFKCYPMMNNLLPNY